MITPGTSPANVVGITQDALLLKPAAFEKPPKKLPGIQILRGIAAALVVLHHLSEMIARQNGKPSWFFTSGISPLGAAGVDIFFVISGFIMFYTTEQKRGKSGAISFLYRRLLRIYPLYWFWSTVLLLIALSGIFPGSHPDHGSRASHILFFVASYLLVPISNGINFHPFLDQGWTLSFELLFYVVFALGLAFGLRRSMLAFLASVFAVVMLISLLFHETSGIKFLLSNTIIVEFLYGVFLARLLLNNQLRIATNRSIWIPICISACGCLLLLFTALARKTDIYEPPVVWRFIVWGIPSALIVLGFASLGSRFAKTTLVYLGDASFTTYLSHTFFIGAFHAALLHSPLLRRMNPDIQILALTPLTILLTLAAFRLVEKPITRLLNDSLNRPQLNGRTLLPAAPTHRDLRLEALVTPSDKYNP